MQPNLMQHHVEVMISTQDIQQRITELAQRINQDYQHAAHHLVLVGLLRGSFIFMADLCRQITVPHEVDFLTASSYGNAMSSSRDVKIIKDLDQDIRERHVLIVEDIIDSGNTLSKVRELFWLRHPASIELCTLIDKPTRREVEVAVKYVGFAIADEFIVGFGIDYAQHYRHLPYIAKVVPHSLTS